MLELIERAARCAPFITYGGGEKGPHGETDRGWNERPEWCSLATVNERLARRPDANVGTVLGPRPGLIDIEVDAKEPVTPEQAADSLRRLLGDPDTLSWRSRRGAHYIYLYDPRFDGLPSTFHPPDYPGIEIRLGSQAHVQSAVPPSTSNGFQREWINDKPVAPCPIVDKIVELASQAVSPAIIARPDDDIFEKLTRDPAARERAKHYLSFIDPDLPYPDWLKVGMALNDIGAFDLWDQWSRKGTKYREGDCDRKRGTFTGGGVTLGTLHHLATLGGMADDKPLAPNGDYYRWQRGLAFLAECDTTRYLVKGVLAEHEPMLFAAPIKTLKTSCAVDLAISLLTGEPFLGVFAVEKIQPAVMLMSRETQGSTLRDLIRRIARAKGVADDKRLDNLILTPQIPNFGSEAKLVGLTADIKRYGATIVIIDPAYAAMNGESGSSVTGSGKLLFAISEAIDEANATLVLLHHTRKENRITKTDPTLMDVAGAGFGEWARQWLLLKRTEEYKSDGHHRSIKVCIGGSAGHQGLYYLDADEGLQPVPGGGQTQTKWAVTIEPTYQRDQQAKQETAACRRKERMQTIVDFIGNRRIMRQAIKDDLHIDPKDSKPILKDLLAGHVLECSSPDNPWKKNTEFWRVQQ